MAFVFDLSHSLLPFILQEMADITSKTAIVPVTHKVAQAGMASGASEDGTAGGGFQSLPTSIHHGLSEKLHDLTEKLHSLGKGGGGGSDEGVRSRTGTCTTV